MNQKFEESRFFLKNTGRPLRPLKLLLKAKSSSPDENPITWIVSSSNVAFPYAYLRSHANLNALLALASCVSQSSDDQDSDE